jgi:RNA polymerase sigma-70 factor (ECF subfamily)
VDLPETKYLVSRLRNGDKKAFESIYLIYHKQVLGLAIRYLKDQQLAEDAVQDVFSKLWSNRHKLDSEKSIKAFLFTVLKNHVLNMIKKRKRQILRQFEYAEVNKKESRSTDQEIIYEDTENILSEGLNKLPEKKKIVFNLKTIEGYSNREIANQLGISIHTVKSQFYKANKFIKNFLSARIDLNN